MNGGTRSERNPCQGQNPVLRPESGDIGTRSWGQVRFGKVGVLDDRLV